MSGISIINGGIFDNLKATKTLKVPIIDNLSSVRGAEGDIVFNRQTNSFLMHDGTEWDVVFTSGNSSGVVTGSQGESGPTGAQGPQGSTGSQGPQGPAGAQGSQGFQGSQGEPGPTGAQGSQGAQGNDGEDGPTGAQGVEGTDGVTGPTGAQGVPGPPGGPTGPTGAQGSTGSSLGPQGPKGPQGESRTKDLPPGSCDSSYVYWNMIADEWVVGGQNVHLGCYSSTNSTLGSASVALGFAAQATGDNAISIGQFAATAGPNSIAMGTSSEATATGSIAVAIGNSSGATALGATAVGNNSKALDTQSLALGDSSTADGQLTIAIGNLSETKINRAVAIGNLAKANNEHSIAIGSDSTTTGDQAIAIGNNSKAQALKSTALGFNADAMGAHSISIGDSSVAEGINSLAIGKEAKATGTNSVNIGVPALANIVDNTVMMGTAASNQPLIRISNVATMTYGTIWNSGANYEISLNVGGGDQLLPMCFMPGQVTVLFASSPVSNIDLPNASAILSLIPQLKQYDSWYVHFIYASTAAVSFKESSPDGSLTINMNPDDVGGPKTISNGLAGYFKLVVLTITPNFTAKIYRINSYFYNDETFILF